MAQDRYIDIENVQARKRAVKTVTPPRLPPRLRKTVRKKRPYSWEPIHVYIYRNGDDVSPALRLTVRRSDVDNWEQLLLSVGDRLDLTGYVKRLYNLNGDWVRGSTGIRNGQYYVAVGGYEAFRNVMYGQLLDKLPRDFLNRPGRAGAGPKSPSRNGTKKSNKPAKPAPKMKNQSPSRRAEKPNKNRGAATKRDETDDEGHHHTQKNPHQRHESPPKHKPEKGVPNKVATKKKAPSNNTTNTTSPTKPAKPARAKVPGPTKKSTSPAGPTDQQPKEKNGHQQRKRSTPPTRKSPPDSEDSAYMSENERRHHKRVENKPPRRSFEVINGVPPTRSAYYAADKAERAPRQKKVTLVDYDEDNGGVYKAKRPNSHTKYAREVREMHNLPVDLPLDEVEATEVGEEIYDDDTHADLKHRMEDHGYNLDHLRPTRDLQSPTRTA